MRVVSSLLRQVSIDALLHGNVTLSDAKKAELMLQNAIASPTSSVLPEEEYPQETLIQLPLSSGDSYTITVPTKDATESNTAVEVYFQVSKDEVKKRVLVDLLEHVLYEPLFDQVRPVIALDCSIGFFGLVASIGFHHLFIFVLQLISHYSCVRKSSLVTRFPAARGGQPES